MISQEEAKDFIRRYKEVVLDTPVRRSPCLRQQRGLRGAYRPGKARVQPQ